MTILDRFNKCCSGPWVSAGLNVQYRIEESDTEVAIYFQPTSDGIDWAFDFFFATADFYGHKVHAGFLLQWLSIRSRDDILHALSSKKNIRIFGYSLGAAIAELATFEAGKNVEGVGFGTPRVFWLSKPAVNFTRYCAPLDIVTHLPFALFGYRHTGKKISLSHTSGYRGKFWLSHHTPEQYRRGLTWQDRDSTS